jgi:hypothetical protein
MGPLMWPRMWRSLEQRGQVMLEPKDCRNLKKIYRLAFAGIEISPPDDDYLDDDNDGDVDNPPWLVPRVMTTFD